jgi:hypothetical protein
MDEKGTSPPPRPRRVGLFLFAFLPVLIAVIVYFFLVPNILSRMSGPDSTEKGPSPWPRLRPPESPLTVIAVDGCPYRAELDADMHVESTRIAAQVLERRDRERGSPVSEEARRRFVREGQQLQRRLERTIELLWKARKAADGVRGANRDEKTRLSVEGNLRRLVDDVVAGRREWPKSPDLFARIDALARKGGR